MELGANSSAYTVKSPRRRLLLLASCCEHAGVGVAGISIVNPLENPMVDIRLVRAFVGAASLVATMATAAPTMQRAWVSGAGADTPTCGPAATPCRTFQYMHDNIVVNGGSIFVKDSAGYGPIAISKSISIINDGAAMAAIFAASGNAISVAGSGAVVLKGLTLDGGGSATNGVAFTSNSGSLTMANCTVRGFASNGVSVVPLHDGNIAIVDSLITGNAGAGVYTFGDTLRAADAYAEPGQDR